MSPFDGPGSGARDGTRAVDPDAVSSPDALISAVGTFLARCWATDLDLEAIGASELAGPVEEVTAERWWRRAEERVSAGLVDPATFSVEYRGQSPERLLGIAHGLVELLAATPSPELPTWVHGGLRFEFLRLGDGRVTGWIPPTARRYGDRYLDLVCLARDAADVVGPAAAPALFDAAGVQRPSPVRVECWSTLLQLL